MRLIGFHLNTEHNMLSDSTGRETALSDLRSVFEFLNEPFGEYLLRDPEDETELLEHPEYTGNKHYRFAWDLDSFLAPLFRLFLQEFPKEDAYSLLQSLQDTARCEVPFPNDDGTVTVYSLWYARGKGFSIRSKGAAWQCIFYHLSQFYPADITCDTAEECQVYAKILSDTLREMGIFLQMFRKSQEPLWRTLYSPINLIKPEIESLGFATFKDQPKTLNEFAWEAGDKPWQEAFQIGYFPTIYDYDLSRAYSRVTEHLLDTRDGEWKKSRDPLLLNQYLRDSTYCYCPSTVYIPKTIKVSPILCERAEEPHLISFTGHRSLTLSRSKLLWLNKLKGTKLQILDGWFFFPKLEARQPFKELVEELSQQKENATHNRLKLDTVKRQLAGLFGYVSRKDELWNPAYSDEIIDQTAVKVANLIYKHKAQSSVVQVATDGFASTAPIPLDQEDMALGWSQSYTGPALIMNHTDVWYSGKRPRGFTLEQVLELINSAPEQAYWEAKVTRILTLGDALRENRLEKVGTAQPITKSISLIARHDRHFPLLPTTGQELLERTYQSAPFHFAKAKEPKQ